MKISLAGVLRVSNLIEVERLSRSLGGSLWVHLNRFTARLSSFKSKVDTYFQYLAFLEKPPKALLKYRVITPFKQRRARWTSHKFLIVN